MPKIISECKNCGGKIEYWPSQKKTFCNHECANIFNAKERKEHIYFRLLKKINYQCPQTCWLFIGSTDQNGYGKLSNRNGRGESPERATRVMYEMVYGEIPEDKPHILHSCDNPQCVNPAHLSAGTQEENLKQAAKRGRLNPKSLENLQPGAKGYIGAGPKQKKE